MNALFHASLIVWMMLFTSGQATPAPGPLSASQRPLPEHLHKYLYAHADPVNMVDPSGHESISSMQIATAISVSINGYSAAQNIRAGRYAMAAVDILSIGFGIGGMGGPGALGQLAHATVAGRGVTFAQWAAAARGAQQVSQGVAVFDILMMAMSGTTSGATLGPSGGGGDDSDLYENQMADQFNTELARARARGVQSISVSSLEQLKALLEQNPVLKWVVTSDGKLRIVPKRAGGMEISHAVAAENQAVRAAGEARLRGDALEINRWSGHYQGQTWSPGQLQFEKLGLPVKLKDVRFD
jgi:hypothetical protein